MRASIRPTRAKCQLFRFSLVRLDFPKPGVTSRTQNTGAPWGPLAPCPSTPSASGVGLGGWAAGGFPLWLFWLLVWCPFFSWVGVVVVVVSPLPLVSRRRRFFVVLSPASLFLSFSLSFFLSLSLSSFLSFFLSPSPSLSLSFSPPSYSRFRVKGASVGRPSVGWWRCGVRPRARPSAISAVGLVLRP